MFNYIQLLVFANKSSDNQNSNIENNEQINIEYSNGIYENPFDKILPENNLNNKKINEQIIQNNEQIIQNNEQFYTNKNISSNGGNIENPGLAGRILKTNYNNINWIGNKDNICLGQDELLFGIGTFLFLIIEYFVLRYLDKRRDQHHPCGFFNKFPGYTYLYIIIYPIIILIIRVILMQVSFRDIFDKFYEYLYQYIHIFMIYFILSIVIYGSIHPMFGFPHKYVKPKTQELLQWTHRWGWILSIIIISSILIGLYGHLIFNKSKNIFIIFLICLLIHFGILVSSCLI